MLTPVRTPTPRLRLPSHAARSGCALLCILLATGCSKHERVKVEGGDPRQGLQLVRQYQCGACHAIPGVQGASGDAGPSLEHMGRLSYIAGRVPNQPANMVRWLRNPPELKPGTLMPVLGISDEEARHMAAYLYTLR